MPKWQRALIALTAAAVTSALFINYCNLVYQCGCTYIWAGADAHCNIHKAHGRHCPWCLIGMSGALGVWLSIVLPQAAISFWPARWSWGRRLFLALAAFPILGLIPTVLLGLWYGYWNA